MVEFPLSLRRLETDIWAPAKDRLSWFINGVRAGTEYLGDASDIILLDGWAERGGGFVRIQIVPPVMLKIKATAGAPHLVMFPRVTVATGLGPIEVIERLAVVSLITAGTAAEAFVSVPMEQTTVWIERELIDRWQRLHGTDERQLREDVRGVHDKELIALIESWESSAKGRHDEISSAMPLLFAHRLQSRYATVGQRKNDLDTNEDQKMMRRIEGYIDDHIGEKLTSTAVATALSVKLAELYGVVRRTNGITLHAYILERRVRKAGTLLSDSELAIASIAVDLGFASQAHFTTTFKRYTGHTPKLFRNRGMSFSLLKRSGLGLANPQE